MRMTRDGFFCALWQVPGPVLALVQVASPISGKRILPRGVSRGW